MQDHRTLMAYADFNYILRLQANEKPLIRSTALAREAGETTDEVNMEWVQRL